MTGSRKEAVRYKLQFDKYIKQKEYSSLTAMVAFSGEVGFSPSDPQAEGLVGEKFTELTMNPSLAGRVSVRFVIGRDGGVMSAANGGSDLPDPAVVACVVGSFRGLQFPQTEEGGTATVVYPIAFAPSQ